MAAVEAMIERLRLVNKTLVCSLCTAHQWLRLRLTSVRYRLENEEKKKKKKVGHQQRRGARNVEETVGLFAPPLGHGLHRRRQTAVREASHLTAGGCLR